MSQWELHSPSLSRPWSKCRAAKGTVQSGLWAMPVRHPQNTDNFLVNLELYPQDLKCFSNIPESKTRTTPSDRGCQLLPLVCLTQAGPAASV